MFLALIFTEVDALLASTRIIKHLVYQLIFRILLAHFTPNYFDAWKSSETNKRRL